MLKSLELNFDYDLNFKPAFKIQIYSNFSRLFL